MDQTELFKKVPILRDLPPRELETLAATLQTITLDTGEILFSEGDAAESLYIVLEGELEILLAIDTSDERQVTRLGPGEFVGEMSLLIPGRARTASVRAVHEARLWQMTRLDFKSLLIRRPKLAYTMVHTLTRRLDATTTSAFHDLQEKNRLLQAAYDDLKAAQAQIVEKERLEKELQVAAEIQMSILPQEIPQPTGYSVGALMQPARMVGGDFYDVFQVSPRQTGIVIGDVADKGVPSAIFMARTHALIMSEAAHGGTPGEILRRVNHHLLQLAQSDQFVTVLFGLLDNASGRFDFARAGHEYPLMISQKGMLTEPSHQVGQPVGILVNFLLDENTLVVPPDGTLLLFTDGATDCRNPAGNAFEHKRLGNIFMKTRGKGGQEVCDTILAYLRKFQAQAHQEDDITMVAIHRDAP